MEKKKSTETQCHDAKCNRGIHCCSSRPTCNRRVFRPSVRSVLFCTLSSMSDRDFSTKPKPDSTPSTSPFTPRAWSLQTTKDQLLLQLWHSNRTTRISVMGHMFTTQSGDLALVFQFSSKDILPSTEEGHMPLISNLCWTSSCSEGSRRGLTQLNANIHKRIDRPALSPLPPWVKNDSIFSK